MLEIDMKTISEQGNPYQRFLDGVLDDATRKRYDDNLKKFLNLIPNNIYQDIIGTIPEREINDQCICFIKICKLDAKNETNFANNIIEEYVKFHKKRVESKEISPNTIPNYIKPIKALLEVNKVTMHWKSINKLFPREQKSKDRAYLLIEVQKMFKLSHDITDEVIISMFSSGGFRLEAWDYFTWADIIFFKNDDGSFDGMGVRVYHGDKEEYWTFGTPEAAAILHLYREKWKKDIGDYPKITDPLLRVTSQLVVKAMKQKGVKKRVKNLAEEAGLRPKLPPGKKNHTVKLDHGFRKFFNTMMRRAKVDYLDKEDMMGHKVGLESHYERYVEEDFERFPEYQKVIPFLTISDEQRNKATISIKDQKLLVEKQKNKELEQTNDELKETKEERDNFKARLGKVEEDNESLLTLVEWKTTLEKDMPEDIKKLLKKRPELNQKKSK